MLESVYGDQRRIKQILLNLISNSLKFTEENGKIKISLAITSIQMEQNLEEKVNFISMEIQIQDNGQGIS